MPGALSCCLQVEELQATTQKLQTEAEAAQRRLQSVWKMMGRWQRLAVQERQEKKRLAKVLSTLQVPDAVPACNASHRAAGRCLLDASRRLHDVSTGLPSSC